MKIRVEFSLIFFLLCELSREMSTNYRFDVRNFAAILSENSLTQRTKFVITFAHATILYKALLFYFLQWYLFPLDIYHYSRKISIDGAIIQSALITIYILKLNWWISLFSSPLCLTMYWYRKVKLHVDQCTKLNAILTWTYKT